MKVNLRELNNQNPLLAASVVVLSLMAMTGCGDGRPSLVQVEGTVTVDGEPVEGADVLFQIDQDEEGEYSRPSSGRTDAQGVFHLGTYAKDDGAPVGTYKVGIIKREQLTKSSEKGNPEIPTEPKRSIKYEWITPRDAADPNTSGLTAEVTSSGLEPATFALEGGGEIEVVGPAGDEP